MAGLIKFLITGDTTQLDAALTQTAKKSKSVGEELTRGFTGVAKSVLLIGAATKALNAAGDAAKKIRDRSVAAGERRGGTAVGVGVSGAKLGLNEQQINATREIISSGAAGAESGESFLSQLAASKRRRKPGQVFELLRAQQSGLLTSAELEKAVKTGRVPDLEKRRQAIGEAARRELDVRGQVNTINASADRISAPISNARRIGEAQLLRAEASSPITGAVSDLVRNIPGVGAFAEMARDMKAIQMNTRPPVPVNDDR